MKTVTILLTIALLGFILREIINKKQDEKDEKEETKIQIKKRKTNKT